jgi:hypothetical protein
MRACVVQVGGNDADVARCAARARARVCACVHPRVQAVRTHVGLCVGEANDGETHAGTRSSLAVVAALLAAGADAGARRGGGDDPGGANAHEVAAGCEGAAELRALLSDHAAAAAAAS